ncbi:MAG: SDR family NAD(P)-dependent oxidoreductase [Marinobacterium sp.]|nr:SDR family NAD(P)-dependent oxidoreductase [Marinobacterium sp.]
MNNCKNIPDLKGKVAIVTGSNSGTGYGITYHLARHGCKVIMASRNLQKLATAKQDLLKEIPAADLEIAELDITRMSSIKAFSDKITCEYEKIDFLTNNAGAGDYRYIKTEDGLEENLTINYLGHVALTTRLLPVLKNGSRIVNFSSLGYKFFLKNDLDVDNLMCDDESKYNQMQEYCKAKLCAILYAVRLQQEFEKRGLSSKVFVCHPGNSRTDLMKKENTSPVLRTTFNYLIAPIMKITGMSQSLYDGAS